MRPRTGLAQALVFTIALALGAARALGSTDLNRAYSALLCSLDSQEPGQLEREAGSISAALAAHATPRRMWDVSLMWFALGDYEQAADVFSGIDWATWNSGLTIRGTQPSRMFASGILTQQERYPVDWQWIVGERPPAELSILEGILAEREGDWPAALALFREALVVAPQPHDRAVWVHYYQALQHSLDRVDQEVAGNVLTVLSSDGYPEIHVPSGGQGLAVPAAELEVNATSLGCAEVARFGYEENALERGPLVPVSLVWQCDSSGTVTHTTLALNLVPNAGFEWNRGVDNEYPFGHERSFYHHDGLAYRSVSAEQRGGSAEGVAWIRRRPPANEASFVPAPIRVSPGSCYLHAAWGKSPNGPGQLAIRWRDGVGGWLHGDYVTSSGGDHWEAAAHVVRAPGNAVFADAIVGYQATSVPHFFDNHLLIPLPDAPCGEEQSH